MIGQGANTFASLCKNSWNRVNRSIWVDGIVVYNQRVLRNVFGDSTHLVLERTATAVRPKRGCGSLITGGLRNALVQPVRAFPQISIKPLSKNAPTLLPQGSFTMPGHKEHTLPSFQRFVEVGRVVLINDPSSPSNGKLATIVEIIDHGRALIDGPTTSVPRQSIAFRRVILTPFLIKGLPRGSRAATVGKAFEKAEIGKKWEASGWKKSVDSKATRRSLTDFQRFEVMILKRQRRDIINKGLVKAKKVQA
ncbi:hypothetical protein PCANC_20476 [Puccinia coronata f. sp. avenae]|uniref:Large ribosomal subunit protein eL14 domain-containing protein n=1 Tax=Puccinia coronata f. sp. avenae TaxID=200324 RepID=A0A2N5SQ95_9BASI|nr:hypothetical protein PCANC_20476 [Puccinia coronata f. sp. avenae]